jgi:hypothetical protein
MNWMKHVTLIGALLLSQQSFAIMGAGDVTYDPAVHAELVSMFEQAKELYKNAKEQLDTIVKVESTIHQAYQAYESLKNFDLHDYFESLRLRKFNSAAALRGELSRIEGRVSGGINFVDYQLDQIGNLENLMYLQDAAQKNVRDASLASINQTSSSQITAQSTAALMALAASQEQRRIEADSQNAVNNQRTLDVLIDSSEVYEAMGSRP